MLTDVAGKQFYSLWALKFCHSLVQQNSKINRFQAQRNSSASCLNCNTSHTCRPVKKLRQNLPEEKVTATRQVFFGEVEPFSFMILGQFS